MQLFHFGAALVACLLVAQAGLPEFAVLLTFCLFMCLPRLVGQPWVGWRLAWREGRWTLDRGAGAEMVQMCRASRAGPGGVFLKLQDMHGVRHTLWLLADAVPAQELRKVRVRLLLERGV